MWTQLGAGFSLTPREALEPSLFHLKQGDWPFVPVCQSLTGYWLSPVGRGGPSLESGSEGRSRNGQLYGSGLCQPHSSWGSDTLPGKGPLGGAPTASTSAVMASFLCPQTRHRCRDPVTRKLKAGKGTWS